MTKGWHWHEKPFTQLSEQIRIRSDLERAFRTVMAAMLPMCMLELGWISLHAVITCILAQNVAMLEVRGDYRLRASLLVFQAILLSGAVLLGSLAYSSIAFTAIGAMIVAFGAAWWRHVGSNDYGPPFAAASTMLYFVSYDFTKHGAEFTDLMQSASIGAAFGLSVQMFLWPWRAEHPLRKLVGESWVSFSEYLEAIEQGKDAKSLGVLETKLRLDMDHAKKTLRGAAKKDKNSIAKNLDELNFLVARLAVRVGAIHNLLESLRNEENFQRLAMPVNASWGGLIDISRSVALTVVSRQPGHFATFKVRLLRLQSLVQSLVSKVKEDSSIEFKTFGLLLDQLSQVIALIEIKLGDTLERSSERSLFSLELSDLQTWQLRPLAAALNLSRHMDPYLVRYGLRMSVLAGIGTLLFIVLNIPHGYWLPFTVVIVMQPDYGSTLLRAFERVGGTIAGSIFASMILWSNPSVWIQLFCIAISLYGFAFFLKRRYAFAVFFITQYVILLLEKSGEGLLQIEIERIGATMAGGLLAIVAAHLFWATKEEERFPHFFRKVLLADRAYYEGIRQHYFEGHHFGEELLRLKHQAEHAAAMLFQSLGRMYADPRVPKRSVERLAALANGAQRVFRIGNILFLHLKEGQVIQTALVQKYFEVIEDSLEMLANHSSDFLSIDKEELRKRKAVMDCLDVSTSDESEHAKLLVNHLARAVTEIRAMLTELHGPISPEQRE